MRGRCPGMAAGLGGSKWRLLRCAGGALLNTIDFLVGARAEPLAQGSPARVCQLACRDGAGGESRAGGTQTFTPFQSSVT